MKKSKIIIYKRILVSLLVCAGTLLISGLFNWDTDPVTGFDKMAGDILITLVCVLLIFVLKISGKAGFQKKGFWKGIVLGIPFYIIGILSLFVSNHSIDWSAMEWRGSATLMMVILNMILVGVNEEILMRSLVFTYIEDGYSTDKHATRKAIIISAIIFGCIHLPNILFMDPFVVLVQVINAASAGVLFAVIFSKTRNIWSNIIIHAIVDFMALFVEKCFIGGNSVLSVELSAGAALLLIICGSLPPLLIAAVYEKKVA